jgi:hypothetical protein
MDLWGALASIANLTADVFAVAAIIGASIILLTALNNRVSRGRPMRTGDRWLRWSYPAIAFGALIVAGILMTEGFTSRPVGLIFPMNFQLIVLLLVASAVMVAVAQSLGQGRRGGTRRSSRRTTRRRRSAPRAKSGKARPRART